MTLIRALPELSQHTPPSTAREQLQQLEVLAQQELAALQIRCAQDATVAAPPSPELASLAWDLGLAVPVTP